MKTSILIIFTLCLCISAIWARPKPVENDPPRESRDHLERKPSSDRDSDSNLSSDKSPSWLYYIPGFNLRFGDLSVVY